MTDKWPSDLTIKFIQEFNKAYKCLYDTKSPPYNLKQLRDSAWKKVVDAMNLKDFGINEAKRKMRNLRSTYYQEKNKILKSYSSGVSWDEMYAPSIKWYGEMDSLLNDEKERKNIINSTEEVYLSTDNASSYSSDVEAIYLVNDVKEEIESIASPKEPEITSETKEEKIQKSNLKRKIQTTDLKQIEDNIKNKERRFISNNQFDIFGKSVAAQLKSISLEKALLAQVLIQKILSEHAVAQYRENV